MLTFARGGGFDLVELEADQVEFALARARQLPQRIGPAFDRARPLIGGTQLMAQRQRSSSAVGIQEVELGGREHQLSMLVLTVEREQAAAQLLKIGQRG